MASTSEVDYSFSNEEKLPIHNQDTKRENVDVAIEDSVSEVRAASVEVLRDPVNPLPGCSRKNQSLTVNDAIGKIEKILENLKRNKSPEYRRVIRHESKKRSRSEHMKQTSTDISSDESDLSRSPSVKRMKKDTSLRYDSDSTYTSDRSLSCVSKHLKKELSKFLGDSFVSLNSKRRSRKPKSPERERNASQKRSREKKYSSYSREERTDRERSYESYRRRTGPGRSERYGNYSSRNYHGSANDIEERYSRYYAVMYAFSIIMDILRQDDIYSTF